MSKGEIATKDLGDGTFEHTYTIDTYYLTQTVISPVIRQANEQSSHAYLLAGQPLGQYEPYRLSQCVQSRDVTQDKGQLIQLARVENEKLVINPKAVDIFRQYPNNQISFVGNYGRLNSGKSFWYDRILNLSQFDGNNYSSNSSRQGIYFWSIPFTKGNLKFFLLDYVGFSAQDKLTREDQMLLDLELLLGQKFVIVPEPEDQNLTILGSAYRHLLDSQQRFSDKGVVANKFSPFWPNEIYTLYRSGKPVRKQIDNIGILFEVYNFSILHDAMNPGSSGTKKDLSKSTVMSQSQIAPLNQKYVRMTSIVFQDIYQKMKGKKYGGITFTGTNLPQIIQQATMTLNNGRAVKVDQIFKGVKRQTQEDVYKISRMLFLEHVEPLRRDTKPKSVDTLIEAFERGNQAAFNHLDNSSLNRQEKNIVETKLRTQFDAIEQEIMQQNQRRTHNHYITILPTPGTTDTQQAYLQTLKYSYIHDKETNKYDHNDTILVAKQLTNTYLAPEDISNAGAEQEEIYRMKRRLAQSQRNFTEIKESRYREPNNVDPTVHHYRQREEELVTRSGFLQRQLYHIRQIGDGTSYAEKEQYLSQLRDRHTQNQQFKAKLAEQEPCQSQQISVMQDLIRRMIAKNKQHEDGIQSLQKSFTTNRSANRSVIRQVKQEHIKKSSIK